MAEVAALVLAISGGIDITIRASSQVTQLLRLWNNAPEQIASLSVDIHHMHWVVVQLEQLCEDPAIRADASIIRAISGHLLQAHPLSVKLEKILKKLNEKDERSRSLYWMRSTAKISSLLKEIEQLRLACVQTLAFCVKSQASRVERAVKNGNELNEHWHAISIGLLSDIQERLKEQAALSHELNKKNVEENFSSPSIQNMARSKVTAPPGIPASSQDCDSNCSCRCHMGRKPKWCRLELLYGILGSVIINRGESSHCNDASCVQSGSKHDKLVYSTPRWLAEVFMMAFLKMTDVWPTISLPVCQTVNIVDTEDSMSVIALAKTGSLPELKIAIANRPRAVFDVWHDNGFSALHIAAIQGSPGMVAHLISRGADPFLEDHWGVPAIFECYQRILRGNDTPEVKELLAEQLRLSVFFEDYDFSHIHFVVLGIRSLDLHTELNKQEYKHKVNDRDGMGMTPLHWASIRGDADATLMRATN
ncbi:hypothetical protein GRF29_103g60976 [Pseudopithomyces chartarum]|uniref:Ankyrin repeat protein n=1 Tax=Pseudopithomyces chartarum TaxID=1892770 RepID=A0AAN6LW24_9PLEO|nr:hypothetical protein GRF29_103g60976 [Pseudopithomyces chartarum]